MSLAGLFNVKGLLITGAVAFLAGSAVGGKVAWTHQDGKVARAEIDRDTWRRAATDYKKAATGWKASFNQSEGYRSQERSQVGVALSAERKACTGQLAAQRASQRALNALLSEKPAADAQGCPVRRIFSASELAKVLRPEVKP